MLYFIDFMIIYITLGVIVNMTTDFKFNGVTITNWHIHPVALILLWFPLCVIVLIQRWIKGDKE